MGRKKSKPGNNNNSTATGKSTKSKNPLPDQSTPSTIVTRSTSTNNPSYHRVNYLYQASRYVRNCSASNRPSSAAIPSSNDNNDDDEVPSKSVKNNTSTIKGNRRISAFYLRTMREVQQKTRVRSHPYQKRTICKRCNDLLITGEIGDDRKKNSTMKLRWKSKRSPHLNVRCGNCGFLKRFVHNVNYELKLDKND